MPQGWSSDTPDGELLYIVHGIIDTWTADKSMWYAKRGYVHYHELILVGTGAGTPNLPVYYPSKVFWLRHTARTNSTAACSPCDDVSGALGTLSGDDDGKESWIRRSYNPSSSRQVPLIRPLKR
jgi:hypothetical protein